MSESTPTIQSQKSYTSGPFSITESTLSVGGRDWLSVRATLTQEVMIPIPDAFSYRKVQVEGERAILGMLSDRVSEAIENLVVDGDK